MFLKQIIASEITNLYPDIKPLLVERYATKYCSAVLDELRLAIQRPENDNNELSFNSTQANTKCGRIKYQKQTLYLFAFMNRSGRTRLIEERFQGQLGKYKRVILNPIYQEQIMHELLEEPTNTLTAAEIDQLKKESNRIIPIDTVSLTAFIEQSRQTLTTAKPGSDYYLKIHQNILFAQELILNAQIDNGQTVIYESWVTADTGREYGRYNSLQRLSKEVRHAALGVCYKYDFQAHSFAVMASIAKSIDSSLGIAAVEDYVRYRTVYRDRIARDIGVSADVIKRVFTALGFGARPVSNPFNSIRRLFYTDAKYAALINQTDFKFITEDLARINHVILSHPPFDSQGFTGFGGYEYSPIDRTGKKRSNNQRLAWIYQNAEAAITQEFIRYVRKHSDIEPVLTVHDCVYYKQKLPNSIFIDSQVVLRQDHQFQYVKLEREDIYPIATDAAYEQRFEQYEREEQEHQERMSQLEQDAQGYISSLSSRASVASPPKFNIIDKYKEQDYSRESYTVYGYDRDTDPFYDDTTSKEE